MIGTGIHICTFSTRLECPHCGKEYCMEDDLGFWKHDRPEATKTCECGDRFGYTMAWDKPVAWKLPLER